MSYLELAKKAIAERPATKVLKKAQTRFGLLEVTEAGAYFPERGVFFSNQELDLVMDKWLCLESINSIFKLKEVFEGEIV